MVNTFLNAKSGSDYMSNAGPHADVDNPETDTTKDFIKSILVSEM